MARVPVTCSVEANQIFYYITPRFLPGAPSCANLEWLSRPRGLYTLPRGGSVYPLAICPHSQTYWKSKWGDRRGPGHRVLRALAQTGAVKQLMGLLDIHMQSVDAECVSTTTETSTCVWCRDIWCDGVDVARCRHRHMNIHKPTPKDWRPTEKYSRFLSARHLGSIYPRHIWVDEGIIFTKTRRPSGINN